MAMLPQPLPAQPMPGFDVWWLKLGRIVAHLLKTRAHTDVVITIKEGQIQLVRNNQSFRPDQLPNL